MSVSIVLLNLQYLARASLSLLIQTHHITWSFNSSAFVLYITLSFTQSSFSHVFIDLHGLKGSINLFLCDPKNRNVPAVVDHIGLSVSLTEL